MFIRISRKLYRGPQPEAGDLLQLRGLTQVVNLRQESQASREMAASLGLEYLHLPVWDGSVPGYDQVDDFLRFVREGGVTLVHCHGGIGRTGVFVSCYRVARLGWDPEGALAKADQEAPEDGLSREQRRWVREWARNRSDPGAG